MSKFEKDDSWALIFHHNSFKAGYFGTKSKALLSFHPEKFSVLSRIDNSFKQSNGKFEFALVYPEFDGYAQWYQTTNPIESEPNTSVGYEKIYFEWDYMNPTEFDGLGLSTIPSTNLLDGSRFDWGRHYCVGLYHWFSNGSEDEHDMPGPVWIYKGRNFTTVDLYIRINNIGQLKKLYSICTLVMNPRFRCIYSLHFIIFFLIE